MYLSKRRLISFALSAIMVLSPMAAFANEPNIADGADIELTTVGIDEPYTADFTKLKESKTPDENGNYTFGTESDVIKIDTYTTAYLTYEGTYMDATGKVYLTGGNNGKGGYANCSYIEFTAPVAGTVEFTANAFNYFVDGTYESYNKSHGSVSKELKQNQKIQIAQRVSGTYVESLTFTPIAETPEPTDPPEEAAAYQSPKTTWDFNGKSPAITEKPDVPYISGTAEYDAENQEIKFPFTDKNPGYLTVALASPIKATPKDKNVKISFSIMNHTTRSGTYANYKILNSEGEAIVSFQAHPYSYDQTNYPVTGVVIGGEAVGNIEALRNAVSSANTDITITTEIDYYARKAKVTAGTAIFEGDIPESAVPDVKTFEFSATRTATEGTRYLSLDDLTIEEYTSTAEPSTEPQIANGYTAEIIGEMSARVKAPAEAASLPLLIYLCGSARFGTDNYSQLYNAQYLFDAVGDNAILIAPQTETAWDADTLKAFIDAAKTKYSAEKVIVAGQGEGADAAYALADTADKIIPIGGVDPSAVTTADARVWAFADYADANIVKIRTAVNALQKAQKDVTYTEFPFEESKSTAEKAAEAAGLVDWITTDVTPQKTVDLVLFAGQSNMAGRGEYAQATMVGAGHGFEYHSVTEPGVLTTVSEPFGKYENNNAVNDNGGDGNDRRTGDMVSSFMESYYNVSGVPIVGVQCSRGGTESKWWYQTTDSENNLTPKAEAVNRYKEAEEYLKAAGYTIGKKFMVWCQGCSDADNNRGADAWKTNTMKLFGDMKTETGITDLMIVRIGHCRSGDELDTVKDPRYRDINLAGKALADANNDVTAVASLYTDEYLAQMRDQYHYHQPVYNSVGNIAGNNAAVTLYPENGGEWTTYPEPEADAPDTAEGTFEIKSSDAQIDVSEMKNYGADTYRIYKADKSYVDVKATDGKVENPTNGEVTVIPIYRFNLAETAKEGYTSMRGVYSKETGYGTYGTVTLNADGAVPESGTLRVLAPAGRYDITVTRKGQTRFNVKNDDYIIATNNGINNGHQNRANGSAVMYAPQVLTDDDTIDLSVSGRNGGFVETVEIVRVPDAYLKPVVYIAGDSESANYYPNNDIDGDLASDKIMMTGFGMMLPKFLTDNYKVYTLGEPSATIRVWTSNYKDSVLHNINADDTILVDFGINEVVSNSNKISVEEMKTEMAALFTEVKAKGAKPILVSPVSCGKYQDRAYFTYNKDTGSNEASEFAAQQQVSFIDLNKWTEQYIAAAARETGTEQSVWEANNYHVADDLHMTQHGALLAASFIAAGMKDLGYKTTDFAYTYTDISSFDDSGVTDTSNYHGRRRGAQTANKRVYSVAAATAFMTDGTIMKPNDNPPVESDYPVTVSYNADTKTLTLTASDDTAKAAVIKAAYEGGKMSDVKVYPDTAFTDKTAAIEDIEIGENDKIFVWDSLAGMKPLSPVFTSMSAPEITQKPTEKPTADPDLTPKEYIYRQDFEGSNAQNGWTSPAGTLAVKSDPTSGIGKYMTVVSGKSGTCRSGYVEMADAVNQSFVFECDYKSTSNANVSDLELLESKSSVYANHGRYSNAKYAFTMARPMGSDLYVINNGADDSGFKLESYADPVFKSKEIAGDPWLHVKVVGDMENHTATAYITSLDGQTEYYHGMTDMSPDLTSWKCIHLLSPSTGADTCIDNIEIYKARESDLSPQYHKVKITCKAYSFEQYVLDGESVVNIPDVSGYGQSFEGWQIGYSGTLYTSDELAKQPITSDCEIVGQISADYIEAMAGVEFNSFPAGKEIVMGADENTYSSNPISLTITGEQGTSLVTSPDSRVTDFNVEWTFDGFRTLDGTPTGETDSYCEHYGEVVSTETAHNTAVDFRMKQTASNYYGRVTAVVTYNSKTISVSRPLLILGTKSNEYMLPKPGYTADYNKYEDTLVGYSAEQNDLLLGGWESYGSDSTSAELKSDSTGKYLSISRAASGNSSAVYNRIGDITVQTVFEQDVRFGNDGAISYVDGKSMTEPTSTAFTFEKSGTAMKFNGTAINGVTAAADKWYHVVIHADPTSKKCFAKVYEKAADYSAAQPIGQTAVMDFQTYMSGAAYRISPAKTAGKSIDINNVKIYTAEIDENKMTITAADTASIPSTVTLTASAKTADGTDAIGKFEWSIADELAEGVSIESTGDNTALLTVTDTATAGDVTVRAVIGGKSVTQTIKLTGKAGISFTEAPAGIRLEGGEYTYKAVVMNEDASVNSGAAVTYSLANADGSAATVTGVSINGETGALTVGADAKPQTIYIKASIGGMTRLAKTVLYDLKFSFVTNVAASGFTAVPSATAYSGSLGFGVEGGKESADGLTGGTFKLKLERGKVYEVKATYSGTITCERIDSGFTGFTRTKDSMSADIYQTAIFGDDMMDISINGTLKSIEVTPVTKTKASKPDWWTIGDSTIQQNGSWAYTITGGAEKTSDLSKYPELAAAISAFHNSGRAGRQHMSYYNEGLLNAVLCGMNPGDAVSISGMGTNDSSSTQAQFKAYDEMYMNAILDMGGYVILGSYTPSGNYGATEGKVYDSDNMTFKGKRANAYELAIRELYEENKTNPKVLGFLDIGQIADDKMTADVKAAYNGAEGDETAKRAAADAKAAEMMAWWKDYNHYYVDFSNYILPDLTKAAAKLIGKIS